MDVLSVLGVTLKHPRSLWANFELVRVRFVFGDGPGLVRQVRHFIPCISVSED